MPQSPILPWCQPQVATDPPVLSRVLHHLSALRISPRFSAQCQVSDLLRVFEGELALQGSLQVRFIELNLPTCPIEERHKDPISGTVVAAHVGQYRRMQGED